MLKRPEDRLGALLVCRKPPQDMTTIGGEQQLLEQSCPNTDLGAGQEAAVPGFIVPTPHSRLEAEPGFHLTTVLTTAS